MITICCVCQLEGKSVIPFSRDRASSVAVVIRDLTDGKDIVSQNPDKAMLPASTMKCFTSAAAIEAGLDSVRFETNVYIAGELTDGILDGNLIIGAIGDPTIESAQFPTTPSFINEIVAAVKSKGIKHINGEILIDYSRFPDNGPCDRWELSDTRYAYGAGLYALNYRDNSVGDKAMENPEETFGEVLENKLAAAGVTVGWDATDTADHPSELILTHRSPDGLAILSNLMKRSDNLFAEAMLRQLAPGQSRSNAIAKERQILSGAGVSFDVTDIYDGSGLSRNNRVTARAMADMLSAMSRRGDKSDRYIALFPRVGKEGTVKSLLKGTRLQDRLALKSGSMNGVHCYAGYKLDQEGKPTHAVVILVNDFFCKRAEVRTAISNFLLQQF